MELSITAEIVESESLKAKEEAKIEETIISGDFNLENGKEPIIVVVIVTADHHAKVPFTISPEKTVKSVQETKSMKNDKKKKQKNEVQVSITKPFVFYLNAKRYINEFNEVELCGLGMAIPTIVTIVEILKRNGFAIQKGITTSTMLSTHEDQKGRQIEKAKIEIVLGKAEKFEAVWSENEENKEKVLKKKKLLHVADRFSLSWYCC
ncbi:hypothetical protein F3Y22_tig00111614pilonHSYRG00092 [Hibiscus syriacus]|uniref:DNA/RNA-binding protein Alba-like domain-containing protein n=1 Tax=Hibiscus syriacus TaxID=106335 RepID=A0A6A2XKS2_HIBSY|nr:hypothetical protein F3Y22_tig00111614pilonHSYRG00092 [Hibiscus syriacus]